ncbi:MAG: PH domain-containing protein [Ignavibacteria bacterium]|nr:PH domain-containing protein [Ignavibacteria bacterium]
MPEETLIWKGTPSQKTNIGFYILTFIFIIPPIVRWLKTRTTVYEITTQRIIFHNGIFTKRREELELYRVKDFSLVAPFLLRIFGLENIILRTSDRTSPDIILRAVPRAENIFDQIRTHVEAARDRKRVREVDYDQDPTV